MIGSVETSLKTTGTGFLLLAAQKLTARRGHVSIELRCASSRACKGKFSLTTRLRLKKTKKLATVVCASTSYSIDANQTGIVNAKLRPACLAALRKARLEAKLTSYPRTGQHALIRKVQLSL